MCVWECQCIKYQRMFIYTVYAQFIYVFLNIREVLQSLLFPEAMETRLATSEITERVMIKASAEPTDSDLR